MAPALLANLETLLHEELTSDALTTALQKEVLASNSAEAGTISLAKSIQNCKDHVIKVANNGLTRFGHVFKCSSSHKHLFLIHDLGLNLRLLRFVS